MKLKGIARLFAAFMLIATSVILTPFRAYSVDETAEEVRCFVGEIKILPVSKPLRVAIGNPAIADVANVTKSELTINPKSAGSTTLIVWDNFGEQSYRLRVFSEDTSEIKRRVDNLISRLNLPEVTTKAEDDEGKVLLLGSVKSAQEREKIAIALGALKDKTVDLLAIKEEETSLEIEVQVIEVDSGYQSQLGFTWPGSVNFTEIGSAGLNTATGTTWGKVFHVADLFRGTTSSAGVSTAAPFTLKLDALIQEGKARILSRPKLVCQSGKEAKLVVGGEVPVLSGSVTPGTSGATSVGATVGGSVEYKEYGIILNINPKLEDKDRIHLNLNVVVSELGDQVSTTYALAYKLTKRTATTELFLDDGDTMAIGGLIKKKNKEVTRKVPWLSNIPIVGAAFRQKVTQQGWNSDLDNLNDTELFITLTPRIVGKEKVAKELVAVKPAAILSPLTVEEAKDPVLRYSRIIQKKIMDNLTYPAQAKEAGYQGTVKLSLKISYQGELLESKVKETSTYRLLDDDALSIAQRIAPYPPFPPAIKENEIWVDIPISYQLE